jgi:hypothetical protein
MKAKKYPCNLRSKKAQMEVLGITVIVVFLALGVFFMVRFNILKEPSQTKKVFTQNELAFNEISAIIKTTSEHCSNIDMLDLMIDCVDFYSSRGDIVCDSVGGVDIKSCEYMNHTVLKIFNETLGKWNQNYIFNITVLNGNRVESIYGIKAGHCAGERRSGQYYFESNSRGTVHLKLDICG